jgi:hypothetical protein
MEYEAGMHEAQQHVAQQQVAQQAAVEMTHTSEARQSVRDQAIDARSALSAASSAVGSHMENLAEDLREDASPEVTEAVDAWRQDVEEQLEQARESVVDFFRKVERQIDAAQPGNEPRLMELAEQAAQAARDFAVQVEQQSRDLSAALVSDSAENPTVDADAIVREASERTEALQDELTTQMQQMGEELKAALIDTERASQLQESQPVEQMAADQNLNREAIALEAMARLEQDRYQMGDLIELQPHRAADKARDEMGVSGQTHQSAHAGAQSALESVDDYNMKDMLTRVMDKAKHSEMDAGWKRELVPRGKGGETDVSVQELYESISRSIDAAQKLTAAEKESHKAHLSDELFTQLGLRPDDRVRMPGTKRP